MGSDTLVHVFYDADIVHAWKILEHPVSWSQTVKIQTAAFQIWSKYHNNYAVTSIITGKYTRV
jgi:hypothetical protein